MEDGVSPEVDREFDQLVNELTVAISRREEMKKREEQAHLAARQALVRKIVNALHRLETILGTSPDAFAQCTGYRECVDGTCRGNNMPIAGAFKANELRRATGNIFFVRLIPPSGSEEVPVSFVDDKRYTANCLFFDSLGWHIGVTFRSDGLLSLWRVVDSDGHVVFSDWGATSQLDWVLEGIRGGIALTISDLNSQCDDVEQGLR